MPPLHQAQPLGGLCLASLLPFRDSCFTAGLHPPAATSQRCIALLLGQWDYRPFQLHASWRTYSFQPLISAKAGPTLPLIRSLSVNKALARPPPAVRGDVLGSWVLQG